MRQADRIKAALEAHNIRPNKALGQNFLVDEGVIQRIVDAADAAGRVVVEIGPGLGALTKPLCAVAARVVAVEKDAAMAEALAASISGERLAVVNCDFLDCDLSVLTKDAPYIAVGNLPYYVTTPIVEKILTHTPASATLMVQAEAAERFFARPGDRVYGPVAVLSQTLFTPLRVADVSRDCFYPQPEVDSTVVRLCANPDLQTDGAAFLRYLKRAFAMRRKTLRNNLLSVHTGFDEALVSLGLPAGIRAEAIDPFTLHKLYRLYAGTGAAAQE